MENKSLDDLFFKFEELDNRVDDLVMSLSQQADSAVTNVNEKLEEELQMLRLVRGVMKWLIPIMTTVIISLAGALWTMGDKLYSTVQRIEARVVAIENRNKQRDISVVTHRDLSKFKDHMLDLLTKAKFEK
jgi:hypothetical protein